MGEKEDIVDIYLRTKDFQRAVKESGLPALVAHIKLLESGVVTIKDRIDYCSESVRRGAEAEKMFQEIVTKAVDANRIIKMNNPIFDFMYGDLTIDIKYSSLHEKKSQRFWEFRPTKSDILVAFLESEQGTELKYPYILIIPHSLLRTKSTIHIAKGSKIFFDFVVQRENVEEVLQLYERLKRRKERIKERWRKQQKKNY